MKSRSIAMSIAVLILGSLLGLGCQGLVSSITAASRSRILAPKDIQERYKMAVVRIDVYEWGKRKPGGGTGFIVSPDGYVLTCAHVLETHYERTAIKVVRFDLHGQEMRPILPGQVIHLDKWQEQVLEGKDIALLKVPGHDLPTVRLGNAMGLEVGDPLVHLGYPEDSLDRQELIEGFVEATSFRYRESLLPTLRTNLHFIPGHSGGPVFNFKGEVVGVAESVLKKVNQPTQGYVIPLNFFYPLLGRAGVRLSAPQPRPGPFLSEKLLWEIGLDDDSSQEFTPGGFMKGPATDVYEVGRDVHTAFPQMLDNKGHTLITIRYTLKEKPKGDLLLVLDTVEGVGGDFSVSVLAQSGNRESHYAGTYTFDAGAGPEVFPRRCKVLIRKEWTRLGENLIIVKNDNLVNTERRIYWDYLALYQIPSTFSSASNLLL